MLEQNKNIVNWGVLSTGTKQTSKVATKVQTRTDSDKTKDKYWGNPEPTKQLWTDGSGVQKQTDLQKQSKQDSKCSSGGPDR